MRQKSSDVRDHGFTLVEILVVLAIIGLIATMATPTVLRYLGSAKVKTTQTQINNLRNALELYFIDNGVYPETTPGLMALVEKPDNATGWRGPYLKGNTGLKDAWGNEFSYEFDNANQSFRLISLGQDGKSGGSNLDADLE